MVNVSSAAQIWLQQITGSLSFYSEGRFFDMVKKCCDEPENINDELSEWLRVVRNEENQPRLPAFAERLKAFTDPRATYELYLMGFPWGLKYPSTPDHVEMARRIFGEHIRQPLTIIQKELLADMVRNSAQDGDFVFQALLNVVDKSFERFLVPRIDEARDSLKDYLERPDWEGDYYDQINVIMYEKRISELESLLQAARKNPVPK
ncbi:MAG: hypothetical protein CVV42_12570 [Candidatus Riflebacteria bacterium HGW-Riflebacteria-2]|jgi:hypothetical protein|nr:MAG: hypothetical protein CVV42_12570 [Candidatus Riflebacteria bacterium HGW-Riflebacteria-2]